VTFIDTIRSSLSHKKRNRRLDNHFDGHLVGAPRETYQPSVGLESVQPVRPEKGGSNGDIIWVNGIMTDVALQKEDMQQAADTLGKNVIGIHNATEGMSRDLLQCLKDKAGRGTNPAVESLTKILYNHLSGPGNSSLHVVGHSQGALIAGRSLKKVQKQLRDEGCSAAQAAGLLGGVTLTTLGGAGARFPDGPVYQHVINVADPIPMTTGAVGLAGTRPGKGAQHHFFFKTRKPDKSSLPSWKRPVERAARMMDQTVHGPRHVYLDQSEWNLI